MNGWMELFSKPRRNPEKQGRYLCSSPDAPLLLLLKADEKNQNCLKDGPESLVKSHPCMSKNKAWLSKLSSARQVVSPTRT